MAKRSAHDMLRLMADVEKMDAHNDRLSLLIEETLAMADRRGELSDDELLFVSAARKPEEYEKKDLFDHRNRK